MPLITDLPPGDERDPLERRLRRVPPRTHALLAARLGQERVAKQRIQLLDVERLPARPGPATGGPRMPGEGVLALAQGDPQMMDAWADYCASTAGSDGNVVPMGGR